MRRDLAQAGAALAAGDFATTATLLSEPVLGDADSPATADHLRLARCVALLGAGRAAEAAAAFGAVAASRRAAPGFQRVLAALHASRNELDAAEAVLSGLLQKKQEAVRPLRTAIHARQGLAALAAKDEARAGERLRLAASEGLADEPLRAAAALGRLAVALGRQDVNEASALLDAEPGLAARREANVLLAAAAIARLDPLAALRSLRLLGDGLAVEGLWWSLVSRLSSAGRAADVVAALAEAPVASFSPRVARALAFLGAAARRALGQRSEAAAVLARLAADVPDDPVIDLFAAALALDAGETAEAARLLARRDDEDPSARLLRLALDFACGRYGAVRAALPPEALRQVVDPSDRSTAATLAAYASIALGATARGRIVLKAAPQPPTAVQRTLLGYAALAEGHWAEASAALVGTPLLPLARLEHARHLGDSGLPLDGLRELAGAATDPALAAPVAETRKHLRLRTCHHAILRKDFPLAARTLADLRRDDPDLVAQTALLEDLLRFSVGWEEAGPSGSSARLAFLERFYRSAPVGLSERSLTRRTAEIWYLVAVLHLEAWQAAGRPAERLARVRQLLDGALKADGDLAPAAALLGIILAREGSDRAFALLDVAQRHGVASPAIQAALGSRYLELGRHLEAKKILLAELARTADASRIPRLLRELVREESRRLLVPERPDVATGPEASELAEAALSPGSEPFAVSEPHRRLPVLAARLRRGAASAPRAARERWDEVASTLGKIAATGDLSGLAPAERVALALLSGAAAAVVVAFVTPASATTALGAPLAIGALFGWGAKITLPQAVEALGSETALGRLAGLPLPPLPALPGAEGLPAPNDETDEAVKAAVRLPLPDFGPLLEGLPPLEPRPWPAFDTSRQRAGAALEETGLVALSGVDPLAVLHSFESAVEAGRD